MYGCTRLLKCEELTLHIQTARFKESFVSGISVVKVYDVIVYKLARLKYKVNIKILVKQSKNYFDTKINKIYLLDHIRLL